MPNLAEFGKNGRISDLPKPKPKPKFGATLQITQDRKCCWLQIVSTKATAKMCWVGCLLNSTYSLSGPRNFIITTRTAREVLFSVVSVCVFGYVCQHNNSWTIRCIITKFSGQKGEQVRKWLYGAGGEKTSLMQRCPWVHISNSNPTQSTSLLTQSNPSSLWVFRPTSNPIQCSFYRRKRHQICFAIWLHLCI